MDRQTRCLNRPIVLCCAAVALLGVAANGGCSWLGRGKLQQYQLDNQRLIDDFRAERDRSTQLDVQNRALTSRVAELENKLTVISDAVRDPIIGPMSEPQQRGASPPKPLATASRALPSAIIDPWRARPE